MGLSLCATVSAGSGQLGTGAATQIEGSAGSGLVPWAVIAGYGTQEEQAATAFYTHVDTGDYRFSAGGAAIGWRNRVELSYARQELDLVTLGPAIGLPGASLRQDVFGVKLRVAGDLVYSAMPQIAVGVQHKRNQDFLIPSVVGARDDSGTDFYITGSKLFLAGLLGFNGFVTGTLRFTKANEIGLLGFGGDLNNDYDPQLEVSGGLFINRFTAIGFDYRQKPDNLSFASEDDWRDVYLAWFPNRHLTVVLAYADLGSVATLADQDGWYLSLEGGF